MHETDLGHVYVIYLAISAIWVTSFGAVSVCVGGEGGGGGGDCSVPRLLCFHPVPWLLCLHPGHVFFR